MKSDGTAGRLSARVFEAVQTRIELFGFELGEERDRLLASVVVILLAGVFTFVGLLALNIVLVLAFWEQRLLVSGLLAAAYLAAGAGFGFAARSRHQNAPPPFAGTVEELRNDAKTLRGGGPG